MVQQNGAGGQNNLAKNQENPETPRRFSIGSEGPSRGYPKWTTV